MAKLKLEAFLKRPLICLKEMTVKNGKLSRALDYAILFTTNGMGNQKERETN